MKITQTRLKKIIQEELAAVAAEGTGDGAPSAEDLKLAVQRVDELLNSGELSSGGWIEKSLGEIRSILRRAAQGAIEDAHSGNPKLEEGMFGLTTDASCKDQLDKQSNMWMSRVNSLYQALRAIDGAAADMALDNAGMTAGDLRPAEHSRLEE